MLTGSVLSILQQGILHFDRIRLLERMKSSLNLMELSFDRLVQSGALAMELRQSYTKPSNFRMKIKVPVHETTILSLPGIV